MDTKGRLLLVDDEKDITFFLGELLRGEEYMVHTAQSGHEALEILDGNRIDVLITDVRMPKMNGIELINSTLKSYPEVQCIILTGHGDLENSIEAMQAGAINYLTKPVNYDLLILAVQKAFDRSDMVRSIRENQIELEMLNRSLEEKVIQRTEELVRANSKLQEALDEIKKLSGLLPICSYCKNIRDENDKWVQIETYINDKSEAEFSHTICPVCLKRHFPQFSK